MTRAPRGLGPPSGANTPPVAPVAASWRRQIWPVTAFLAVVAMGAFAGAALGFPAPFLSGPAVFMAVAVLAGLPVHLPAVLRDLAFLAIGIGMGAALTPQTLALAGQWPVPLLVLFVLMLALILGGAAILTRGFGFDRDTALLAATPGMLSLVIALAEGGRADTTQVTVMQALRILILTLAVPAVLAVASDLDLSMSAAPVIAMVPGILVAVALVSAALGYGLDRARVPASMLLGGMAVSGLVHGLGWVEGTMPPWLALPAFALMGGMVGARFSGLSLAQIAKSALASVTLALLALIATFAAAEAVHRALGLARLDLLIAYAPGGIETMAALALILGADIAFVAVFHIARLIFISAMMTVLLGRRAS